MRVMRDAQGGIVGQVFLSDALENGAGYCTQFASPEAIEGLLRYVSDPTSRFCLQSTQLPATPTGVKRHAPIVCATIATLPDDILDWRMALDLARLSLDANAAR